MSGVNSPFFPLPGQVVNCHSWEHWLPFLEAHLSPLCSLTRMIPEAENHKQHHRSQFWARVLYSSTIENFATQSIIQRSSSVVTLPVVQNHPTFEWTLPFFQSLLFSYSACLFGVFPYWEEDFKPPSHLASCPFWLLLLSPNILLMAAAILFWHRRPASQWDAGLLAQLLISFITASSS